MYMYIVRTHMYMCFLATIHSKCKKKRDVSMRVHCTCIIYMYMVVYMLYEIE